MKLISTTCIALLLTTAFTLLSCQQASVQGAYDSATFNNAKLNKTELKVLRVTPHGIDVSATNRQIVFKFDQPVVPIGDMKRKPEDIPVDISRALNCQWLWLDTSSLSCRLTREDQFKQATKYSITLKPGIKTVEGLAMNKSLSHSFTTQRPSLQSLHLQNWLRETKPLMLLYFNQPVTKSSIEKYIKLKSHSGQLISIVAENDANPLTDHHFQQKDFDSDFVELDYIPTGNTEQRKAAAKEQANIKRAGAFDQARTYWYIAPASKDRMAEGAVTTYEDLANPELSAKVCTRSGKHEYMVALIASVIAHSGEEAAEAWLTGLKSNLARKPEGNDRAQVKAISQGQCDIAIINSHYMGAMMSNEEQSAWADSVRIFFPNQDDRGTHMNISGMSLTRSAPNKENAVKLMEFLSGDLAQRMYGEQNHDYPVNPDVTASGLVQSWGEFDYDPLPLAEIAKHRVTATKMVDKVGYDG